MLITLCLYAWAIFGEVYALQRLALGQYSSLTPLIAVALAAFFVLVFRPIAFWVLANFRRTDDRIVAAAEELLYRCYTITRLFDLTGSYVVASIVSVLAFGLAHVPV